MEINEAIEVIKGTQPFTFGRGKFADAVETLVDFAEWYIGQDLIQREDTLVRTAQAVSPDDIYAKIFITLKQIPKAEPPKENE